MAAKASWPKGGPARDARGHSEEREALVTKAVPPDPAQARRGCRPWDSALTKADRLCWGRGRRFAENHGLLVPSQAKPFKPQRQAEWLLLLGGIASRLRKPRPDSGQSREGGRTGAGGTGRWEPQEAQMSAQCVPGHGKASPDSALELTDSPKVFPHARVQSSATQPCRAPSGPTEPTRPAPSLPFWSPCPASINCPRSTTALSTSS